MFSTHLVSIERKSNFYNGQENFNLNILHAKYFNTMVSQITVGHLVVRLEWNIASTLHSCKLCWLCVFH